MVDDLVRKLFDGDEDWEHNACLTYSHDRMHLYTTGYFEAAKILVAHVLENRMFLDPMLYPIVFLSRHFLELSLKCALRDAQDLLDRKRNVPANHQIAPIWSMLRPLVLEIYAGDDPEELKKLDDVIGALASVDFVSTTFRYPENRDGSPSIPNDLRLVNIRRFWEKYQEAADLIDSINCGISQYLESKQDMEREW